MEEVFEKANFTLREYLLNNKDKVRADLENMRSKSVGTDVVDLVRMIEHQNHL
jgi:hypothetical protein